VFTVAGVVCSDERSTRRYRSNLLPLRVSSRLCTKGDAPQVFPSSLSLGLLFFSATTALRKSPGFCCAALLFAPAQWGVKRSSCLLSAPCSVLSLPDVKGILGLFCFFLSFVLILIAYIDVSSPVLLSDAYLGDLRASFFLLASSAFF